jgi:hypothetical protein
MVAMSLAHATAALLLFMMSVPSSAAAQQVRLSSFSNNGDAPKAPVDDKDSFHYPITLSS